MEKMVNVKDAVDERDVYTPPCVVRISDLKQGEGDCTPTGSGDTAACITGNSATDHGCSQGNNAFGSCDNYGSNVSPD